LSRKGDAKAALEHAERAARMAPTTPRVLDTLGVALLQNQQAQQAVESLRKATEAAPGDATIGLHLAQALVGVGDNDKARSLLRSLIALNQKFDGRDEARELLARLGG